MLVGGCLMDGATRWGRDIGADCSFGPARHCVARATVCCYSNRLDAPIRLTRGGRGFEKKVTGPARKLRTYQFLSRKIGVAGRSAAAIRQKIIGHGMAVLRVRIGGRAGFHREERAFALLHQPACQQRRGIFFQPGIEQLSHLFAEIGGVTQTRQFIALQRRTRSREKKLPRRLDFVMRQRGLPGDRYVR